MDGDTGLAIYAFGVLIVVVGARFAALRYLLALRRRNHRADAFRCFRHSLGLLNVVARQRCYYSGTAVLETRFTTDRGVVALIDFMPLTYHGRLLESIGNIPPSEHEASYYQSTSKSPMAA